MAQDTKFLVCHHISTWSHIFKVCLNLFKELIPFFYVETVCHHHEALADLKLIMWTSLLWNSSKSSCVCLLNSRIIDSYIVCPTLNIFFIFFSDVTLFFNFYVLANVSLSVKEHQGCGKSYKGKYLMFVALLQFSFSSLL